MNTIEMTKFDIELTEEGYNGSVFSGYKEAHSLNYAICSILKDLDASWEGTWIAKVVEHPPYSPSIEYSVIFEATPILVAKNIKRVEE